MSERKFAHTTCFMREQEKIKKEEKDAQALEEYIVILFQLEYLNPRIRKQIKEYVEQYGFTYSGILKTLQYWYEVKKNDITKANGGIGIVPYVYTQAKNYYHSLWLANEKNKDKNIEDYIPIIREVKVLSPQRKIKKKKKFSFLDDEEKEAK